MPRGRKPSDAIRFAFQENPAKSLSIRTIQNYKSKLDMITALSVAANKTDATIPIIKTKDDLLNHSKTVVDLIKQHTDKRTTLCQIYSAVFYALGYQDYNQDPRGKLYHLEFTEVFYDEAYKKKLQESLDKLWYVINDDPDAYFIQRCREVYEDDNLTVKEKLEELEPYFAKHLKAAERAASTFRSPQ